MFVGVRVCVYVCIYICLLEGEYERVAFRCGGKRFEERQAASLITEVCDADVVTYM